MGKTSAAAAGGYDDEETCHYDYEQGQIPRRVSRNDDEDISAMGSRTSNNENGGGSRIPDHIDQYAYGHGYGTSTLGAHRYTPTSSAFAVAASANTPPSAYHDHGRDDRAAGQKYRGRARGEWGGCSGGRNEDDTIPPFVQVDTEIVRSKDPLLEYSRPRDHHNHGRLSASNNNTATNNVLLAPPEVLLQRLSPQEKDELLHQFLSGQISGSAARPQFEDPPRTRTRPPTSRPDKSELSSQEMDLLNVQSGIYNSYAESKGHRLMREAEEREALDLGRRASSLDFREYCRKQDKQMLDERALLEQATQESLTCPDFVAAQEDIQLIEKAQKESLSNPDFIADQQDILHLKEAKFESLRSCATTRKSSCSSAMSTATTEERQIEEAKLESLTCPPTMTKDERLIEEMKRESLSNFNETKGGEEEEEEGLGSICPELVNYTVASQEAAVASTAAVAATATAAAAGLEDNRKRPARPSSSTTEEDGDATMAYGMHYASIEASKDDDLSSTYSDRKPPARDSPHVPQDRAIRQNQFRLPFGSFEIGSRFPSFPKRGSSGESDKSRGGR